jgi:hypothetical protein
LADALPCATLSRALEEPLYGTASRVRGWVLLEQPGPWGREAVTESRLDHDLALALDRAASAAHLRLLLIRRPGRPAQDQPRTCFVAHTSRAGRWLERRRLDDPAELLELDMDAVVAGERPGFGEGNVDAALDTLQDLVGIIFRRALGGHVERVLLLRAHVRNSVAASIIQQRAHGGRPDVDRQD